MIIHKLESKTATGYLASCGHVTSHAEKTTTKREVVSCKNCLVKMGRDPRIPVISINNDIDDLRKVISKLRKKEERLNNEREAIAKEIQEIKKQSDEHKEGFERINQLLTDFVFSPRSEKIIKAQEITKKYLK